MIKKKSRRNSMMVVVAVIALLSGVFASTYVNRNRATHFEKFHGTLLDAPRAVGSFQLEGIDGKPFDNAALKNHWSILFFGFTRCSSLCPTTMAKLGKMQRILQKKGVKNLPTVVMITLDPERDNLAQLSNYVRSFNPNFYGARGSSAQTQAITTELGIAYAKVAHQPGNSNGDDIQHTGALMVFNPSGKLAAFFTTPHQVRQLVADYLLLIS